MVHNSFREKASIVRSATASKQYDMIRDSEKGKPTAANKQRHKSAFPKIKFRFQFVRKYVAHELLASVTSD